jgi:membrane protease YdiL (CAAX protease family)
VIPRGPGDSAAEPIPFNFVFGALLTVLTSLVYCLVVYSLGGSGVPFGLARVAGLLVSFGNAFAIAARRIPRPLAPALGLQAAPASAWLAPFLLLPALLLVSELDNLLVAFFPVTEPPAPEQPAPTALDIGVAAFVLVVIEPGATEWFFRGVLQSQLALLWDGPRAVVATSLLSWAFAVLPQRVLTSLGILPTGNAELDLVRISIAVLGEAALLGIVRQSSGSLYPALLLAALFGATKLLSEEQALRIPGFDDTSAAHTPASWLFPALILTAAGLGLCHRMAAQRREDRAPSP